MAPAIAFTNLGCRLNIAESDALAARFAAAGYRVVDHAGAADVVVVNTCTVTGQADRKSRNAVYRAARGPEARGPRQEQRPLVVATGCYVTAQGGVTCDLPGVDYAVDNDRKSGIFDLVAAHFAGEVVDPAALPADPFGYRPGAQPLHTRATIKIQDGCDNFCTFCIIPAVRGRARSRPAGDILHEARRLLNEGHRELVLTGVNIGRYQWDGWNFSRLLEALLDLPGDYRVRVSSLEPDPLDDRFVDLTGHERLCPHLHLCLQSGSDRVLLRMRREYDVDAYLDLVDRIRGVWRRRGVPAHFTTDIMVGFPGETGDDFARTVAVCEAVDFGHIHTFRYSPRAGTRAARLSGAVPEPVKAERSAAIRALATAGRRRLAQGLIGHRQRVLVEQVDGTAATGYGESYVRIGFPAAGDTRPGECYPVTVTGSLSDDRLAAQHDTGQHALPAATT
jgi:threonylcarbamoyladenosine tRNA methylthiotransferase MtaB